MPAQTQPSTHSVQQDQPWRAVWPADKNAKLSEHVITYGARKGCRMIVDGSAGNAPLKIVYDTAKQ
ncbi:uncharacterized protein RHO25_012231 [Cercospora beticola]|nr:hypothetical protein RHO25_012231 [Cercospora beticola]